MTLQPLIVSVWVDGVCPVDWPWPLQGLFFLSPGDPCQKATENILWLCSDSPSLELIYFSGIDISLC